MNNTKFRQRIKFNIDDNYYLKKKLELNQIKLEDLHYEQIDKINILYDKEIMEKMQRLNYLRMKYKKNR